MNAVRFFLVVAAVSATPAFAARIDAMVRTPAGAPLENAVVWAVPKSGPAPFRKREAAVEQKDRTFVPLVTVVQVGTAVQFPNRDPIRHHVYSFSAPKPFEIKLYAGTPADPVVFDKPGEVVLGCNIHDHMLAFIYVVESPWFGKAGPDGRVRLDNVPAGDYELRAWHHAQAAAVPAQPMKLSADATTEASFAIATRALPARPQPK